MMSCSTSSTNWPRNWVMSVQQKRSATALYGGCCSRRFDYLQAQCGEPEWRNQSDCSSASDNSSLQSGRSQEVMPASCFERTPRKSGGPHRTWCPTIDSSRALGGFRDEHLLPTTI